MTHRRVDVLSMRYAHKSVRAKARVVRSDDDEQEFESKTRERVVRQISIEFIHATVCSKNATISIEQKAKQLYRNVDPI